jgi:hypothetical protein
MAVYALTDDQVVALAKQKARGDIRFIAIDYNWGPPVSGRFDTDWMRLWAVTKATLAGGILYLQGTKSANKWDINAAFTSIADITNKNNTQYCLYHLELSGQYEFPVEFVLRFDANDGSIYYDNNNHQNYKILNAYQGRGLSALGTDKAIFDFDGILPCHLFWPTYPPPKTS